jgi:hypothetical protein
MCGCAARKPGQRFPPPMNPETSDPFRTTVLWLARHADFPRSRLPEKAESLVCVAALAAEEEAIAARRFLIQRRDPAQTSALRAHGLRRSQVHFKCDNSPKV